MNEIIKKIIANEENRQANTLGMIPSENYASLAVRKAVGSVLMNKYSEGYPYARYYEGNVNTDELEDLCRKMVVKVMTKHDTKEVSSNWHANVQVLSGSTANLAVYNSVLKKGDIILSMYLPDGGHLSHGWSIGEVSDKNILKDIEFPEELEKMIYRGGKKKISIISKIYNILQYKTDPQTNLFDYDKIEQIAKIVKPKLIITGGTSYPRNIDYKRMRSIANEVNAYYHADVAHEAGLIAGGAVPSPFAYADFVTFTTHKTLRGPRGAVAMCKKKYSEALDKAVFPGMQGGPFNHNIAGILQALFEADTPEFEDYTKQVVKNAVVLANELVGYGFRVITDGTDKHLVLAEVQESKGISGKYLAYALAQGGIISNMNTVPYEKGKPANPSGIRFGTPILTTRGFKENDIKTVAKMINEITNVTINFANMDLNEFKKAVSQNEVIKKVNLEVIKLCNALPFRD